MALPASCILLSGEFCKKSRSRKRDWQGFLRKFLQPRKDYSMKKIRVISSSRAFSSPGFLQTRSPVIFFHHALAQG